jgi:hypothetical protein
MNFYFVPIVETNSNGIKYRDAAFVQGRFNAGLNIRYSFFDFGSKSKYGLLACDGIIGDKDAYQIPVEGDLAQSVKLDMKSVLKKAQLDDVWVGESKDWRAAIHRIIGLSQAMQSAEDDPKKPAGEDDPSKWLGRFIHCGDIHFAPLDIAAFTAEQQTVKQSKELLVKEFFRMGCSKELLKQATSQQFFALPASDVFTAADTTLLTAYSASWTNNNNTFKINTNRCGPASAGECMAHWNADTFSDNQYATATLTSLGTSGVWVGVSVRAAASGASGYGLYAATSSGQTDYLYKLVSGTYTTIDSIAGTYAVGNTIRLEVSGTTLTPMRNGSTHAMGTSTDSSHSSGYGGVAGYGNGYTTNNLDDLSLGDLGGAAGQPMMMRGMNIPGMRVGR